MCRVLDFTIPLLAEQFTLIAPRSKGNEVQLWVYLQIFPWMSWLGCLVGLLTIAGTFYYFNTFQSLHEKEDPESFGLTNSIAVGGLFLIEACYPMVTKLLSTRIAFFTSALFAYMIFSYYTCDLTARMTASPPDVPIRGFEDVILNDYRVLVKEATANEEVLKTAKEGTPMEKYYRTKMKDKPRAMFGSYEEGKERLLREPKTLLFESSLAFVGDSKLVALKTVDGVRAYSAWALQKGSQFTGVFNHHLQGLSERGTAQQLLRKWTYLPTQEYGTPDALSLSYGNTLFPFGVMGCGVVLAIAIACGEFVSVRLKKRDYNASRSISESE